MSSGRLRGNSCQTAVLFGRATALENYNFTCHYLYKMFWADFEYQFSSLFLIASGIANFGKNEIRLVTSFKM